MNAAQRVGLLIVLAMLVLGCEPRKPGEPKPPVPKVDFNLERSTS
jgi:hypothetical protein